MTDIGYARVSADGQSPTLQLDAHTGAGCARVFTDIASSAKTGTVYQHLDQNAAAC